jgi:hypothetical protein
MNKNKIPQSRIVWIPLATALWLVMWFYLNLDFYLADPRNYIPSLVAGLTIGSLSGLPPRRAFRSCFLGFAVIWLFLVCIGALWEFSVGVALSVIILPLLLGSLSGLFGMGGALLRMIILHKEVEVYLKPWEWALLTGGMSIFTDILFFFDVIGKIYLIPYRSWTYVAPFPIAASLGIFALGLVTGAFYSIQYEKMRSFLVRAQVVSHTLYLFFFGLFFVAVRSFDRNLLLAPVFCVIYAVLLFLGAYTGYHLKKRESPVTAVE